MMPPDEPDQADPAEPALLADLGLLLGRACATCRRSICGHEALFSIAMGAKDLPRCLACLAQVLERPPADLRDQLAEHFRQRRCYSRAWQEACDREGQPRTFRPVCLWPAGTSEGRPVSAPANLPEAGTQVVTDVMDAGDMGCGELVMALRIRLNSLPSRAVLEVSARDPAAPEDLPAWCRLTGHRLLKADHPVYLIQRKEI